MIIKNYIQHPIQSCFLALYNRNRTNWIPDAVFLKLLYKYRTGNKLNLKHPMTFNEKIQWLKVNDRRKEYSLYADKYSAKELVKKIIGKQYIVDNYGVWEDAKEIDFEKLPSSFVLKCTHDCGGLVICRDKSHLNIAETIDFLNQRLAKNYYYQSREWCYYDIKPRIIAEKYLEEFENGGVDDYKFFCFSGMPKFLYISHGLENHSTAKIGFFDLKGNSLPFSRKDYCDYRDAVLPNNFEHMINVAKRLAQSIDNQFIRVDLYSVGGKVYFSEFTFYPCSGMMPFQPEEYDRVVGDLLIL